VRMFDGLDIRLHVASEATWGAALVWHTSARATENASRRWHANDLRLADAAPTNRTRSK
jgi:hypothetical protein